MSNQVAAVNLGAVEPDLLQNLPMVGKDIKGQWFLAFKLEDGGAGMEFFQSEEAAHKALRSQLAQNSGDDDDNRN